MLLVVDVGNTQTHIGVIDGGEVVDEWRMATVRHRTSDEIAGMLQGLFSLKGERLREADRRGRRRLRRPAAHAAVGRDVREAPRPRGVRGRPRGADRHAHPRRTRPRSGADRIVNAVAAYETYGGPCIVADYGTATTFDVISAEGDYLGGAIAPGIEVSLEALTTRAAKLIKVELIEPEHAIGKSTTEALQSGAVYGFAGEVEGVVHAIWAELGVKCPVIATGGLAEMIARHTDVIETVDPFLTLRGIEIVMRRQQRA